MKKRLVPLVLALLLSACVSSTPYGDCVGAFDQAEMKPDLKYKVSTRNVVMAVVFSEMIVPPIIVILNETHCPVGKK